jgi:hypothetical protein
MWVIVITVCQVSGCFDVHYNWDTFDSFALCEKNRIIDLPVNDLPDARCVVYTGPK